MGSTGGKDGKTPGKRSRKSTKRRTPERARASIANGALGRRFAELLEDGSHQLGVCGKLGIPWRTHMEWMAAKPDAGSPLAAYQGAILAALDRLRMVDLEEAQTKLDGCHPAKAGAQFNLFRFRHENRFKRFYADETAQKHQVELTGKEGGPVQSEVSAVQYIIAVPPEETDD